MLCTFYLIFSSLYVVFLWFKWWWKLQYWYWHCVSFIIIIIIIIILNYYYYYYCYNTFIAEFTYIIIRSRILQLNLLAGNQFLPICVTISVIITSTVVIIRVSLRLPCWTPLEVFRWKCNWSRLWLDFTTPQSVLICKCALFIDKNFLSKWKKINLHAQCGYVRSALCEFKQ